ncbi:MAG TPA: aldehyde ferredoxin oxidoreductase N-terminal domain-containing protein, partial [Anaerolineae bacterium]|nr:aldehyde ferredoxin oxidoreductase N-terminal domain-containing protein [Anaerolineae bacterium]
MSDIVHGYAGHLLRVDLSDGRLERYPIAPEFAAKWVGGTGLGAKILFDEVPAGVEWDDPQSRVIVASGPLGGTRVAGTGTYSVVFKGPMTNLAGASQASGFLGAFLKLSGVDAVVIQGAAPTWCYLYIHDGGAELRAADHLLGRDTWEVEDLIAEELGVRSSQISVCGIGVAGENRVRFAALAGEKGHVAAHNGIGAVLGAKKLKAIAVARGSQRVPVYDAQGLVEAAARLLDHATTKFAGGLIHEVGTGGLVPGVYASGQLPSKNYTTNI